MRKQTFSRCAHAIINSHARGDRTRLGVLRAWTMECIFYNLLG